MPGLASVGGVKTGFNEFNVYPYEAGAKLVAEKSGWYCICGTTTLESRTENPDLKYSTNGSKVTVTSDEVIGQSTLGFATMAVKVYLKKGQYLTVSLICSEEVAFIKLWAIH